MAQPFRIYNTLHRQVESFQPLHSPFVGIYLCGPTVYGHPHLGHCRGPIVFDVLRRYLLQLGYKVRFVRNITDVGHLVDDADEGEDKVQKKAKMDQLEPMEVAQEYTDAYNRNMERVNVLRPSIEPRASGHIPEQIAMIEEIMNNGFAYEVNGSVYFDVQQYAQNQDYGKLSGRVLDDLIAGAGAERRSLEGQDEKRNPNDFALWKKADPSHLMKWESPWSVGYPGWHIECSAMSSKYLGETFDIHAGGMDLLFPHHEAEIAQSTACSGHAPVRYWMHNNMITINGQKMAKSLNNGILMDQFFSGDHPLLEKAYSPMTLRFFVLQAHYRGTLDFSNEALQASEKGLARLTEAIAKVGSLPVAPQSEYDVAALELKLFESMNEDMNTPMVIAHLFEAVKWINTIHDGKASITAEDRSKLQMMMHTWTEEILGLRLVDHEVQSDQTDHLMRLILELRQEARGRKDFATSDKIRDALMEAGFEIKDGKEGTTYSRTR